jgi:DNA-binding NtrC family response regulator
VATILIVEDQPENRSIYDDIVSRVQSEFGLRIQNRLASDFEEAQQALERGLTDPEEVPFLILLDMELPYQGRKDKRAGYHLMQQYREHFVDSYWVPLTANIAWHEKEPTGDSSLFDDLYKLQPFDVFSKGKTNDLKEIVRRALKLYSERLEHKPPQGSSTLSQAIIKFDDSYYAMSDYQLYREIRRDAEDKRDILLFGEPGTGKSLTALMLHAYSERRNHRFCSIDAMIETPELEKDLFPSNTKGELDDSLLNRARGGTLYIANFDKMGDIEESQRLQRKLLHYRKYKGYDFRLIGGINRNRRGFPIFNRFLPELLERVIPLDLPPLHERTDDIPFLLEIFLEQFNRQRKEKNEKPKQFVNPQQIYELLQALDWQHNNIAQLQMVVNEVLPKSPLLITVDDFKAVLEAHTEYSYLDTIEVSTEKGERRKVKTTKPPLIITDEDLRRFGIR